MMSYIVYRKGYKYQLQSDYTIRTGIRTEGELMAPFLRMSPDGELTISRGYAWDGASGPTADTLDSMRGSLIHDALYQLMRLGLLERTQRDAVDKLFLDVLIEDGMSEFRANLWYQAVRSFAGRSATAACERKLIVAPRLPEKEEA